MSASSGVIELRQYTLHPGRRDDLIALFEREFVETQEAEGIHLIGWFVDLDDPDRFVWLRGFPDMESRKASLAAFYGGPAWAAHRDAANATMIDSDNVLMLRALGSTTGLADADPRLAIPSGAVLIAGVHDHPGDIADLADALGTALAKVGLSLLAVLETEEADNTFPRLPVRTDGPFIAWFASARVGTDADLAISSLGLETVLGPLRQRLRLGPARGSGLRP